MDTYKNRIKESHSKYIILFTCIYAHGHISKIIMIKTKIINYALPSQVSQVYVYIFENG